MQRYKTVEEFIADQDAEKLSQIELLRRTVKAVEPSLEETLKWNAPNYVYNGNDRITFNLMNKEGIVKLVLHMGTKRKEDKKAEPVMDDPFGVIQWNSDIRGMISFKDLADVQEKTDAVSKLVQMWLKIDVQS